VVLKIFIYKKVRSAHPTWLTRYDKKNNNHLIFVIYDKYNIAL